MALTWTCVCLCEWVVRLWERETFLFLLPFRSCFCLISDCHIGIKLKVKKEMTIWLVSLLIGTFWNDFGWLNAQKYSCYWRFLGGFDVLFNRSMALFSLFCNGCSCKTKDNVVGLFYKWPPQIEYHLITCNHSSGGLGGLLWAIYW